MDGANLYEYVRSSPVGLRDPMGLASVPGFGKSSGCGGGGSVGFDSCGGSYDPIAGCLAKKNYEECASCCRDEGKGKPLFLDMCLDQCKAGFPPAVIIAKDYCGSGPFQWIPDRPFGYDFAECCKRHDECYVGCEGRQQCDNAFCLCLAQQCLTKPTRREALQCAQVATWYCGVVQAVGRFFYECEGLDQGSV